MDSKEITNKDIFMEALKLILIVLGMIGSLQITELILEYNIWLGFISLCVTGAAWLTYATWGLNQVKIGREY